MALRFWDIVFDSVVGCFDVWRKIFFLAGGGGKDVLAELTLSRGENVLDFVGGGESGGEMFFCSVVSSGYFGPFLLRIHCQMPTDLLDCVLHQSYCFHFVFPNIFGEEIYLFL